MSADAGWISRRGRKPSPGAASKPAIERQQGTSAAPSKGEPLPRDTGKPEEALHASGHAPVLKAKGSGQGAPGGAAGNSLHVQGGVKQLKQQQPLDKDGAEHIEQHLSGGWACQPHADRTPFPRGRISTAVCHYTTVGCRCCLPSDILSSKGFSNTIVTPFNGVNHHMLTSPKSKQASAEPLPLVPNMP